MDQLKAQLAVVMKYGFWISCSLVLIASIAIWYMATSKLEQENQQQTSKIQSAIQTVRSVEQELDTLPNDHSHAEMEKLIQARQDEVLQSWKRLFDRQRNILTWPVQELKSDFVDEFKDLIPIEVYVSFPTDPSDEKETTLLSRYQRYIKNTLPDIAKIADAEWTAEFERSASMDPTMGMNMGGMPGMMRKDVDITGAEKGPLVKWSNESQQQVLKDLFPWRGKLPSTLEVYYSQENIWILKQLLQIVADLNEGATQPYQARVREIRKINIGKSVNFNQGNISKPGQGAAGGMMEMMGGMEDMYGEMGGGMDMESQMGTGDFGGTGMSSVQLVDPAENRYVNAALEPITGSALRSALTSNSPSDAALAVAKRVPVMMSLNMDQRAVHELIADCGSAPLMVEIHQVRLLPKVQSNSMNMMGGEEGMDDMGGMGGMGGMGSGMGMGMGMGSGMGTTGGGMPGASTDEEFPLDMNVEIYGIIYIYNPPDPEKLGLEQVNENTVLDGATETIGGEQVAAQEATAPVEDILPTPQPTIPDASAPATGTPATPAPATPAPAAGAPGTGAPAAPAAPTPAPGGNPAAPAAPAPAAPGGTAPGGAAPGTTPDDGTTGAAPPVALLGN